MSENLIQLDQRRGQEAFIPEKCGDPIALLMNSGWSPQIANVEAEAALLGALMIDNNIMSHIAWLEPEAFHETMHQRIYQAIVNMFGRGMNANPVTLRPQFENDETMAVVGGPVYLARLSASSIAVIGARDFARQIEDIYRRRLLFEALCGAMKTVLDYSVPDVGPTLDALDEAIASSVMPAAQQTSVTLDRAWEAAMTRYDDVAAGRITPGLAVNGLDDFNALLGGGMREGDLIIVAGRPGMGKTALAVTLSSSCARAGIGTEFFSLEMSVEQVIERQITDICFEYGRSFTYDDLKRGKLNPSDRRLIDETRERISMWPLVYDDTAEMKVGHLIGKIRRQKKVMEKRGTPLKVVMIDYLQLLASDSNFRGNKNLEVSEITRALKVAAKDLKITIVLLSQLSRECEKREDKRPMLSDLRDSGSIEQDADAVVFVYREEYYLKDDEPPKGKDSKSDAKWNAWQDGMIASRDRMELIARKVRGHNTGTRRCYFFGSHQAVRGSKFLSNGGY